MRMDLEMREALREAFEAPEPVDKRRFMRTIPKSRINYGEFIILQIGYIKKWIWIVSAVIFGIAVNGAHFQEKSVLWEASSMIPFIALSITTENARSAVYGMEELEMVSRFSLKSVVLARLGILGVFHLLLLCLLASASSGKGGYTLLQTGVYLLVPYLLTTVMGLAAVRKIRGKEAIYVCLGIAVMVSGLYGSMSRLGQWYQAEYFSWWIFAFAALLAAFARECHKTINQAEELIWNLQ